MNPSAEVWLQNLLTHDNSQEFLLAGGSLIRFVVVNDQATHEELHELVRAKLKNINFSVFGVPSHQVDLQHPHRVVIEIAKKLSLEYYLKQLAVRVWQDCGLENSELKAVRAIASQNETHSYDLEERYMRKLRERLGLGFSTSQSNENAPHSRQLSRDFANGLRMVCGELMEEGNSRSFNIFANWLRGDSTVSTRKMMRIQWPIKKENATSTLRSLMALPPMANKGGTVLHLDIRWLTDPKSVANATARLNPTPAARTAVYQWIRELIDQTSEFRSSLIIIEVGPSFVNTDPKGVGIGTYDALKNRILDDAIFSGDPNLSAVLVPLDRKQIK